MIATSCNPSRVLITAGPHATKQLLKDQVRRIYGGSWTNPRRLQNPNITKNIPTFDFVGDGKLKPARMVYICGLGATGALGLEKFYKPDKKNVAELKNRDVGQSSFRRIRALSLSDKIWDIACGYGFTIIACEVRDSSHTALGFGLNHMSQIGYQAARPGCPLEIVATPSPIVLPTKAPISRVACGRAHSLLMNKTGQVFSIGNNAFGQCGRPIRESEIYFGSKTCHELTDLPNNVIDIVCGQDHSLFLTEDGKLFSCGWGADGQTGLGHYNNQHKPTQVKGDIEGVKVSKVSSSADTVLALDNEGNVFGWGNSEYSQFRVLANNDSEQFYEPRHLKMKQIPGKIVDVAAGGTICAILNDRGQVFVWGFGILGQGPNVDHSSKPTLIPETLFGMNVYNPEVKVVKIHAGLSHFAAITNQGDLLTWGKNRASSLGFPHGRDQFFPMRVNMNQANVKKVALGVDHTCAIVEKVC